MRLWLGCIKIDRVVFRLLFRGFQFSKFPGEIDADRLVRNSSKPIADKTGAKEAGALIHVFAKNVIGCQGNTALIVPKQFPQRQTVRTKRRIIALRLMMTGIETAEDLGRQAVRQLV
jgi:hypothetical protein